MGIEFIDEGAANSSLAGADFAGDNGEAFAFVNGVDEAVKSFFMFFRRKEVSGIGGKVKGFFGKVIELLVHFSTPEAIIISREMGVKMIPFSFFFTFFFELGI